MTDDLRDSLQPPRVTNAMWDYSWLRCHHPGGSFEDWELRTDELLERGFNAVRIEAFPWIVGQLANPDEVVTLPAHPLATWGPQPDERPCAVARELVDFIRICHRKDLWVILSTWGEGCPEYPGKEKIWGADALPSFLMIWEKTLSLLADNSLLDAILYVDLDQEFPYFSVFQPEINRLGDEAPASADDAMTAAGLRPEHYGSLWNESQKRYVHRLISSTLAHFQGLFPSLRFTFSITGCWEEIRSLNLKSFDVLELHLWIHHPRFDNRTLFNQMAKDRGPHAYADYQHRVDQTLAAVGPMLRQDLRQKMAFAQSWADEISAPLITSEAWGPWWHLDHLDLRWDWLRDWCEQSVTDAAQHGFWGVTPWNFCHPYFENWADVSWYRRVNQAFLATSSINRNGCKPEIFD